MYVQCKRLGGDSNSKRRFFPTLDNHAMQIAYSNMVTHRLLIAPVQKEANIATEEQW
jgi:hypothetical protein